MKERTATRERNWVRVFALVAAVAALAGYVWVYQAEWCTVRLRSPTHLAACGFATLVAFFCSGATFWLAVRRQGARVGLGESVWLAVLTTAVNTVAPFHGGAAARGVYLKRRHGLDLAAYAATFVGYNVLRVMVAAAAALVAAGWLTGVEGAPGLRGLMALAGACLAAGTAACLMPRVAVRGALGQRVARFHDGWDALRRPPIFLAKMTALVAVQFAAELLALWAAWAAVGVDLGPAAVALIGGFGILVATTGVTPNGLGVFELTLAVTGAAAGVDPVHTVAAAVVARGVLFAELAVLTPVALVALARDGRARPSG